MALALYCPDYGFYETEGDKIGRRGDFFTSVSVGNLFGELLAFQFSDWLSEIQTENPRTATGKITLIEAGAYQGQLARDILLWLQQWRPNLFSRLEYCIAEPSIRLRQKQHATLASFSEKVRWVSRLRNLAAASVSGVIFSNELLDAMPVRRIGWDAEEKKWFEWGVALQAEEFIWTRIDNPERLELPTIPNELLQHLPDGYTTEVCPAASQWWTEAAGLLATGKMLAIDYGLTADELIAPERNRGTLRSYSKHRVGDDLLANPGEQDITAHVNFTSIQSAGEAVGLRTDELFSQEKFLVRIAEKTWKQPETFDEWNPTRRRQFQTLVHPQHMGRPFRVLVQSREFPLKK